MFINNNYTSLFFFLHIANLNKLLELKLTKNSYDLFV